ncbi:MAG: response regulator transcription factor [Halofilum sp. (in: g-proteobacteria)]
MTTTRPKQEFRIVLVDDHPVFRKGLVELVHSEPDLVVCAEASDAASGRQAVAREQPDLVVADLSLGRGSGLELVKDIRQQHREVRVIVVSMYDERFYAERALRAGADGYITKAEAADRIVEGIRTVLGGGVYLAEEWASRLLQRGLRGGDGTSDQPEQNLSDRELEVFRLIGEGYSTRQISDKLQRSPKTIDSHREHIKQKLGDLDNSALIQRAVSWYLQSSGTELAREAPERDES